MGSGCQPEVNYLLDTHVLVWWLEGGRLHQRQRDIVEAASPTQPLLVSAITLWEISVPVELGRIQLALPLRDWLEGAVAPPLVRLCPITPAVAAAVAELPVVFHRDPANRLIVCTSLLERATLLTQDQRIINSKLVQTL